MALHFSRDEFASRLDLVMDRMKEEKLDALLRVLEPYGIRELVQSGVVSLARGPRGIGAAK